MTNKELIVNLLDTDLNAEVELRKTVGDLEFKPVTSGEWIRDGQHAVYCSVCNTRVSIKASAEMNYCFNCGAEMRRK